MTKVRPGDLWLIDPTDGYVPRALVCVIAADAEVASVVFTDSTPELASDQDVVYAAGEVTLWPLRISFGLLGPVAIGQFWERIARVPIAAAMLRRAGWEGEFDASLAARRGPPLQGPSDPRWVEQETRCDEIRHYLAPFAG